MATVFFTDLRTTVKRNLHDKIENLLNRVKIGTRIGRNDLVAIKVHFGEKGNTTYLRPVFLRTIAEKIRSLGANPFLTDTNTLYKGSRSEAVTHLATAIHNGFDYSCVGCPILIADGLRGGSSVRVPIDGEVLREVSIAQAIVDADALIVVTHFKAHELCGFGGILKNIGMGCAAREGKLAQHSTVAPMVNRGDCRGCKQCLDCCPAGAISLTAKKASINPETCIGCGECVLTCSFGAIEIQWNSDPDLFQKKMVEHALGALKGKEKKSIYLNFVMQVSPICDCYSHSDVPIVRDIGILASRDPVALDAASCDLVNNEESLPGSKIKNVSARGQDKWRALYPRIDWEIQLSHAQKLGLGERSYKIVKV
jgi:uncharacterized protein